ncbi:MAG: GNAT family N-acetyltransferase [Pseudomonadota bacterium]
MTATPHPTPPRPAAASDLAALHAINEASVPGVGSTSAAELEAIWRECATAPVIEINSAPAGFAFCLRERAAYQSPNYRWFEARYDAFLYVDRIAVASTARSLGLGAALYAAVFEAAEQAGLPVCAEVNTAPPNPGSLRFHKRLGFREVGEQVYVPGEKAVVYVMRDHQGGAR